MGAGVSSAVLSLWRDESSRRGLEGFGWETSSGATTTSLKLFVAEAESLARHCGQRSLGWRLGERHDFRLLREVGDAILACSTLGAALRRFSDFFALLQDASELSLGFEKRHCTVSYRILDPEIWPRHQNAIFTLALVAQLIRKAAPSHWEEVEVFVEEPDPAAARQLALASGVSCFPGAEANILRFPLHLLELPLPAEPNLIVPDLPGMNLSVVQKRREADTGELVRAMIYQRLGSGQIAQGTIARAIGVSSRTLRRRLADEGTCFQQIVDDCRMRQAAHEFRKRRPISIAQTALRLGYAEHSTFTRAFTRWSGMAPQAFIAARQLV
jgi:AraC-like DNA-binding protein